ncbi:MAG: hypothetical protein J6X55_04155 [Victivallales bacterium]|nr:hypothetical protein [Victivallales bacterium]
MRQRVVILAKKALAGLLVPVCLGNMFLAAGDELDNAEVPSAEPAQASQAKEIVVASTQASGDRECSREGMVELGGSEVALSMDGLVLTRDELLASLRQLNAIPSQDERIVEISVKTNGLTPAQQRSVRLALYHLVRQQLLLRAAKYDDTFVTEEDRQDFARRWRMQHPGMELPDGGDIQSPLKVSRNDKYLIYKWLEEGIDKVEVPEEYVERAKAQLKQLHDIFGKQADQERQAFMDLANNEDLYTDEGFARLAREHSDGVEAERGGLSAEPYTRSQIEAANFDQPFHTGVGETSPLIETPTSLRYIRVLEALPTTMPGEPTKYRIAQILYSKRAMDELPDEEAIRKDLKYQLQEQYIARLLIPIARKFHFECPMIPDLLNPYKKKEAQDAMVSLESESELGANASDEDGCEAETETLKETTPSP